MADLRGHNEQRPSLHGDSAPSHASGRSVFGSVERVIIACNYAGVPGQSQVGGGFAIDTTVGGVILINPWENAVLGPLLVTQASANKGPVRAIAIAADSPIGECDLWLGGNSDQQRHRISAGRPWIGDITELDHVFVTLPGGMPSPWDDPLNTDSGSPGNFVLANCVWEALNTNPQIAPGAARVDMQFPLRLEIYRGELPPIIFQKRAPYHSDMLIALNTVNKPNPAYGKLWTITEGRDRTEVTVMNKDGGGNTALVTVIGYNPTLMLKNGAQPTSVRRLATPTVLDTVAALADQAVFTNTYDNKAFAFVAVRVEPSAGLTAIKAAVHVVTRDKA